MSGVGLPAHFIVMTSGGGGPAYFDPFHAGRRVTPEDCEQILETMFAGALPFESSMLRPATPKETVLRLLRNLKGAYLGKQDALRSWRTTDLLLRVDPDQPEELRDRGLLAFQMGRLGDAVTDLSRYLTLRPGARDTDRVVATLRDARRSLASLN